MRVLVVKLSAFGDLVHALPALEDLLARREVREVHWLVDARYAFATELFPPEVHVHPLALKTTPWRKWPGLARRQLPSPFDAVLDLQGLIKSAVLARLAGAPVYGFDARLMPERPARWLERCVRFHPEERHVVQQYRRIAAGPWTDAGSVPEAPLAYRPPRIRPEVRERLCHPEALENLGLEPGGYAVLHVGGGWQTKQLPEATWRAVVHGLIERGVRPVLSWGSEEERLRAHRLAENGALALPRRLPMSDLCPLLAGARAVIGADTGVVHLAAALGASTISFWGPSASWRSGPRNVPEQETEGVRHWHIESHPPCGPCFRRRCGHFICMDRIRAEDILDKVDRC